MEATNRRLSTILSQITQSEPILAQQFTVAGASKKSPDDVVIISAIRTPICKSKKGGLKDTHWTDLLATVLKAVIEKSGVPARC
jgi:hypothetical protein